MSKYPSLHAYSVLRLITILLFTVFTLISTCWGAGKTVAELRMIAQAGGSLILDLDKHAYSASELHTIAASLHKEATLTILAGPSALSAAECARIAKVAPGRVIFRF